MREEERDAGRVHVLLQQSIGLAEERWTDGNFERQTPATPRLPKSGHLPSERQGEERV